MDLHNQWLTKSPPFCLGHRGFPSAARENTAASFEAALRAGAGGVELDVHVTSDGVPVVHHNPTAWTGRSEIALARTPWEGLQAMRFHVPGGDYAIPTLEEILTGLPPEALINVEIKDPWGDPLPAVDSIVPVLAGHPNVLVSSFEPEVLLALAAAEPSLPLGFLFKQPGELDPGPAAPLFAWHPHHGAVDAPLMEAARKAGVRVQAWTVDDPGEARALLALGVNGIITNRPDVVAPVCAPGA